MKRGVIVLELPEVEYLSKNFRDQKFQTSLSNNPSGIKIQMSEEDAETCLDSLPIPNDGEEQVITSLRRKLSGFLNDLRD